MLNCVNCSLIEADDVLLFVKGIIMIEKLELKIQN